MGIESHGHAPFLDGENPNPIHRALRKSHQVNPLTSLKRPCNRREISLGGGVERTLKGRRFGRHETSSCQLCMDDYTEKVQKPVWRSALVLLSWVLMLIGFFLIAQTAVAIANTKHLTTDTLSWSTAAFLAMLIGSLLNSVAKGQKV